MSALSPITIVLAEDHAVVRQGLRLLLETEADLKVVGEAVSGRQAVDMVHDLRPNVIVMDIAMPLLNGLEATRQIRKAVPKTKVVILSAHSDDTYVEHAMALGASGFVIKQTSAHALSAAIRAAHQGNTFFSPSIAKRRLHRTQKTPNRNGLLKSKILDLTSREIEVLQLIAEGSANKQVAAELGISIKTVEKHRDHLMRKIGIHDTAGLTRYAISAGIIECDVRLTLV